MTNGSDAAIVSDVDLIHDDALVPTLASNADLLQTALTSHAITGYSPNSTGGNPVTVLFNGSAGATTGAGGGDQNQTMVETVAGGADGWHADFHLDTTTNANGYDINTISSISGWNSALHNQNFQLLIHQVGTDPLLFVSLGNFAASDSATNAVIVVTVYNDTTGPLATGVDVVRFVSTGGLRGSYRELDVAGAPTVIPEPATLCLLILGGWMSLGRRPRSC
jgi:hypothetical protein